MARAGWVEWICKNHPFSRPAVGVHALLRWEPEITVHRSSLLSQGAFDIVFEKLSKARNYFFTRVLVLPLPAPRSTWNPASDPFPGDCTIMTKFIKAIFLTVAPAHARTERSSLPIKWYSFQGIVHTLETYKWCVTEAYTTHRRPSYSNIVKRDHVSKIWIILINYDNNCAEGVR